MVRKKNKTNIKRLPSNRLSLGQDPEFFADLSHGHRKASARRRFVASRSIYGSKLPSFRSGAINKKLKHYVSSLTKAINVDKIILFGSYAKGNAHEFSDIDIAVITDELDPKKSGLLHNEQVTEKANLYDPDIQLFAFPTKTFQKASGIQKSFIKEIKKTGKVIYP